jgi:hypothetical protein
MYGRNAAAREDASRELGEAVRKVAPEVTLEFGPSPEGGPFDLTVSADGRPERVDAVKDFVAAAPALPGWNVVAFRARMEIADTIEIAIEGERVGPADIRFRVREDEDGLELTLHVGGLTRANRKIRGLGASLLAEHAVGERDSLTLLSSLQIEPLPEDPVSQGLHPFGELVSVFDEAKGRRYPPPGSLPLSPDSELQAMRGTINGSLALIMFHSGLRSWVGHPDYDRRLTVTIPFNQTRPDGMPGTEEEYEAVQAIGDRVTVVLEEGQESLLAMTIMSQGRREIVLYTVNPDAALQRIEAMRAEVKTHRIEASVERDSFWGRYRQFLQAGQESRDEKR